MWYGKNDNRDDGAPCCVKIVKKLSDKELKEKLEVQRLKNELEQHFIEVLKHD